MAIIKSPVPGVFYRCPSSDASPYKEIGDVVEAGDTIGLVEIMKSFMPVIAEERGVLLRFLVETDEAVEMDQPLCETGPNA